MGNRFKVSCIILLLLFGILYPGCSDNNHLKVLVLSKIKKVAKLAVVKFTLKKMVWGTSEKKILFFKLKDAQYFAYAEIEISAGIDLNKINMNRIKIVGNSLDIRLPPVEILKYNFDFEKTKIDYQYTYDNFFNRMKLDEVEEFLRKADIEVRKSLNHLGIKETTQKKTILSLKNLLKQFNFESVHLYFEESDQPLKINNSSYKVL